MIRRARPGEDDRAAVAAIWRECFSDGESDIRFFLDGLYEPARCLLLEEAGGPVSMLHLVPASLRCGGVTTGALYVYAAATLPAFRGRGRMTGLLGAAAREAAAYGRPYLFLLPGEESLTGYYEARGFSPSIKLRRVCLDRRALAALCADTAPACETVPRPKAMFAARHARFSPALLWEEPVFLYAAREFLHSDGEVIAFGGAGTPNEAHLSCETIDGYFFCRRRGGGLLVKELCAEREGYRAVCALLLKKYDCAAFTFLLPAAETFFGPGEVISGGMSMPALPAEGVYANLMME